MRARAAKVVFAAFFLYLLFTTFTFSKSAKKKNIITLEVNALLTNAALGTKNNFL